MTSRPFRIGRSFTGLGLFATRTIRRGEFIVAYTGRRIPDAEAERRERRGARYMFELNSRWTIDGSSRSNLARYVNHACKPNAEALLRNGGIVYVARRNIPPDQEITVDYGKDYFETFFDEDGCQCPHCCENTRTRPMRARNGNPPRLRRRRAITSA